jgi:hypothetical protein
MKVPLVFFILLSFLTNTKPLFSQEKSGPPKTEQTLKSKRKQRQAEKRKWKEDRKNKRLEEKKIRDHHKRIQTKEVRKRMKRSKQKAQYNRDHKREPFYKRWLNDRKRGKRAKPSKEKSSKVKQN